MKLTNSRRKELSAPSEQSPVCICESCFKSADEKVQNSSSVTGNQHGLNLIRATKFSTFIKNALFTLIVGECILLLYVRNKTQILCVYSNQIFFAYNYIHYMF
jgi:hypothetical protein